MASITSTINLVDQMSPVIFSITNSVDSLITAMDTANQSVDNAFDRSVIDNARTALGAANAEWGEMIDTIQRGTQRQTNFNRQTQKSGDSINNNTRQQQRFNSALNAANSSASRLNNTMRNIASIYLGMQGIQNITTGSDTYTQTQARLGLMVDSQQELLELQNEIFASAQRARSAYSDTADAVAKFSLNAGHAFDNTAQVIQFAENMNKMFKVSGATAQEQAGSMLQLTQALASGTLRGEELNSVLENAPLVARGIEQYMGWDTGSIKNYASDGLVTSEIVRNAVLSMTDDINKKFDTMPITWNDAWTEMKNVGTYAFQDLYDSMSKFLNSDFGKSTIDNLSRALVFLGNVGDMAFNGLVNGMQFAANNMEIIAPVMIGLFTALEARAVASGIKTAAAWAMTNWPLLLTAGLIAGAIFMFNKLGYTGTEILGGIAGGINVVKAYFIGFGQTMANQAIAYWNVWCIAIDNFKIGFKNAINSVKGYFWSFASVATDIIADIATKLNKLPFVDIDTTGLYNAADTYAQNADNARGNIKAYKDPIEAYMKGYNTFGGFKDGWVSDAFKSGQQWAKNLISGVSNKFDEYKNIIDQYSAQNLAKSAGVNEIPSSEELNSIDKNVEKINKAVSLTATDIQYILDISRRKSIDRYTGSKINVNIVNHNNVNSGLDLDGITRTMSKKVLKEIQEEWSSGVSR